MNDCFWFMIGVCGGCKDDDNCTKYLSLNSKKCEHMADQYSTDVEAAIKPIREKYRTLMQNYGGIK